MCKGSCCCYLCRLINGNVRSRPTKFIVASSISVVSHSFEHTTVDSTIWLGSTSVQLTTSPCHKGSIHLQTSMPSPGFEPRPYGIAVSVTNHYTGWAARIKQYNKN
ncbi:hypothetical protein TNCV_4582271 [Trichonephila clavipes]|nr:hypothetical protein TNCV_4582271 [Trichonephila clavipes]